MNDDTDFGFASTDGAAAQHTRGLRVLRHARDRRPGDAGGASCDIKMISLTDAKHAQHELFSFTLPFDKWLEAQRQAARKKPDRDGKAGRKDEAGMHPTQRCLDGSPAVEADVPRFCASSASLPSMSASRMRCSRPRRTCCAMALAPRATLSLRDGGGRRRRLLGLRSTFTSYSTWRGHHGIRLEDLYVTPARRGLGVGKALLAAPGAGRGRGRLPAAGVGCAGVECAGNWRFTNAWARRSRRSGGIMRVAGGADGLAGAALAGCA